MFVSFSLLSKSLFPCNSSVLCFITKSESLFLISVSGSCFLFMFCLILFQDVICYYSLVFLLVLFFVLNHNSIFLALHLVFLLLLLFFVFVALVFVIF